MSALLRVDSISKRFGRIAVADDFSLDLECGEVLGVIGPNGAGKTTLFNLIGGVLLPDSGRIRLGDVEITRMPPWARCRAGIGRTFQIPHPFAGMTVFENTLVGCTFGDREVQRDPHGFCIALLGKLGLLAKANEPAGSLRLLDRKRLELARALASRPRLLLLDEIAGGLTEPETHALIGMIREVRAQGVSIIWIEHIVHALVSVVDRLIALNFGKLICEGDPAEVMSSPAVREIYLGMGTDAA